MSKSLFFNWEQKGALHVAKDPIEPEVRWIIRFNQQEFLYELNRVLGGIGVSRLIYRAKVIEELKWKAVAYRINDLADMLFNAPYLLGKEKQQAISQLFESLNDRRSEHSEDAARGTGLPQSQVSGR